MNRSAKFTVCVITNGKVISREEFPVMRLAFEHFKKQSKLADVAQYNDYDVTLTTGRETLLSNKEDHNEKTLVLS